MKSKRRHELQTNELADQLGHWIEAVRPHLTTISMAVAVVAVLLVGWYYWASSREYVVAEAWRAYMYAGSNPQGDMIKELNSIADDFPDSQAGLWASETAADVEAGQAVRTLFEDKASAETGLDNAIKGYENVLDNPLSADNPLLQTRAHFGLAQTLESAGDLDNAITHYKQVVQASPDTALAKAAQRRVDRLSDESTRQWYAWFGKQAPPARGPQNQPLPGGDLGRPGSNLDTVPGAPGDDFLKGLNVEVPGADSASSPAEDDAASASDTPATDGSAEQKDSSDATDDAKQATEEDAPAASGPALDGPDASPAAKPDEAETRE